MKEIRVLVIDDHPAIIDGICTMLSSQTNKCSYIIDNASTIDDALRKPIENNYDILLVDYQLPVISGAELTRRILADKPGTKILCISGSDDYLMVKEMMDAGAFGYMLKQFGPTELCLAIETVLNGNEYYTQGILQKLQEYLAIEANTIPSPEIKNIPNPESVIAFKATKISLTKREKQVLYHLAQKRTSVEIAKILGIAKGTVDGVRANLLRKFNEKRITAVVKIAIELRLINFLKRVKALHSK